jgi:hypothetical protein
MNIVVIILLSFMAIVTAMISLYLILGGLRQSTRAVIKARLANLEASRPGSMSMPGLLRDELLSEIPALNKILYKFPVMEKIAVLIERKCADKGGTIALSYPYHWHDRFSYRSSDRPRDILCHGSGPLSGHDTVHVYSLAQKAEDHQI